MLVVEELYVSIDTLQEGIIGGVDLELPMRYRILNWCFEHMRFRALRRLKRTQILLANSKRKLNELFFVLFNYLSNIHI